MVSTKLIIVMVIIAALLLGASFLIAISVDDVNNLKSEDLGGELQGSINLQINTPEEVNEND